MSGDEGGESAAGPDRGELAVVADEDQLGPGDLDVGEEAGEVDVVSHARLVQDHHAAFP